MEAIILAAGLGSRLRPYTDNRPKCLVEINGVSILENQLLALSSIGVTCTTLVVGDRANQVRSFFGNDYRGMAITYRENPAFMNTGTANSFLLGLCNVENDFYLLEGDVIFDKQIILRLKDSQYQNPDDIQIAISPFLPPLEGSTVAIDSDMKVISVARDCAVGTVPDRYKTVNIYLFGKRHIIATKQHLNDYLSSSTSIANLEGFVDKLAVERAVVFRGVDCHRYKWVEIDTPSDHQIASRTSWESYSKT